MSTPPKSDAHASPAIAPLRGVKVLELATMITGPLAGMMLGDLGAEVLKIERPGGGDDVRGVGPPASGGVGWHIVVDGR